MAEGELVQHADVIFLTVSDARVREVCERLQLSAAHAVVHTSGALPLSALSSAVDRGARTAVMHPLQAFPHGADPSRFHGIHVGLEASVESLASELTTLLQRLGASAFSLSGVERGAYHAAAVFASNYVVALQAAAAQSWERAGLPPALARAALAPMAVGAAQAVREQPLPAALTGPLVRGDLDTLAAHLRALAGEPALVALYRALGRQLLTLQLGHSPETRAALEALLAEPE